MKFSYEVVERNIPPVMVPDDLEETIRRWTRADHRTHHIKDFDPKHVKKLTDDEMMEGSWRDSSLSDPRRGP